MRALNIDARTVRDAFLLLLFLASIAAELAEARRPTKQRGAKPVAKSVHRRRVRGTDGRMYAPFYGRDHYFSNLYPLKRLYLASMGQPANHSHNFPTAQHYWAYVKAMSFANGKQGDRIRHTARPEEARSMSFRLGRFIRWKWDSVSYNLMLFVLRAKFTQNEQLGRALKATGSDVLVYAHTGDARWGVGLAASDPNIGNPRRWRGKNLMGRALMRIREIL